MLNDRLCARLNRLGTGVHNDHWFENLIFGRVVLRTTELRVGVVASFD